MARASLLVLNYDLILLLCGFRGDITVQDTWYLSKESQLSRSRAKYSKGIAGCSSLPGTVLVLVAWVKQIKGVDAKQR